MHLRRCGCPSQPRETHPVPLLDSICRTSRVCALGRLPGAPLGLADESECKAQSTLCTMNDDWLVGGLVAWLVGWLVGDGWLILRWIDLIWQLVIVGGGFC
jgi:hypothetical protein